jgi:hypothetical protein
LNLSLAFRSFENEFVTLGNEKALILANKWHAVSKGHQGGRISKRRPSGIGQGHLAKVLV